MNCIKRCYEQIKGIARLFLFGRLEAEVLEETVLEKNEGDLSLSYQLKRVVDEYRPLILYANVNPRGKRICSLE